MKRPRRHPNAHWRWWQALAVSLFGFGVFGILPGLLPPFSLTALRIGLVIAAVATSAALWNWRSNSWWSQLALGVLWSLQLMAIALRAWSIVLPTMRIWLFATMVAYLTAWFLPAITPRLSNFLWREQTAPRTRIGRAFLGLMIALAPVAGVLGASVGMYGSRFEELNTAIVIAGSLSAIVGISIAFALAFQLWSERPWAKEGAKRLANT